MKRHLLLTVLMAVLAVAGASAENQVVRKYLYLGQAVVEFGLGKIVVDNNSFVLDPGQNDKGEDIWGNSAVSWLGGMQTDISKWENIVLELEEPTTSTVEIVVANDGFWGMANNYTATLAQGETKISLPLKDMTHNGTADSDKQQLDLTKVNLIFLRTGWVHTQTIKIKGFYLERTLAAGEKDYEEIDVLGGYAMAGTPTADGNLISFTEGGQKWGWNIGNINTSYKYMVVVPRKPFTLDTDAAHIEARYGLTDGTNEIYGWGFAYGHWNAHRALVYSLDENLIYKTSNEDDYDVTSEYYKNKPESFGKASGFFVTAGSGLPSSYEISAVYFTNNKPNYNNYEWYGSNEMVYDYRRVTDKAGQFGTVCLPYAAAVCGADVFEIVGVDDAQNPTKLYMKEVFGVLKAGVPYIFKTNTDKEFTNPNNEAEKFSHGGDVTFHRAGANTVAAPINNALCGSFSTEKTVVPEGSYILKTNGRWGKGTGNTVGQYKAYLTLTDAIEIPKEEASAAKYIAMDIAGGTTAISEVKGGESAGGAIYSLSGVRVDRPQKGLYIKNGKKIIVK